MEARPLSPLSTGLQPQQSLSQPWQGHRQPHAGWEPRGLFRRRAVFPYSWVPPAAGSGEGQGLLCQDPCLLQARLLLKNNPSTPAL